MHMTIFSCSCICVYIYIYIYVYTYSQRVVCICLNPQTAFTRGPGGADVLSEPAAAAVVLGQGRESFFSFGGFWVLGV